MAVQSFRESIVWQKAMDLSVVIYSVTRLFPKEELFGLTSQLRRASVSIASNIAEGQGRLTTGEFLHFLGMARGSALEIETQLELSRRLALGTEVELIRAQEMATGLVRNLNTTITSIRLKKRQEKSYPT